MIRSTLAAVPRRLPVLWAEAIFGKLCLPPSGDDNRRVLAVLAYLQG